MKSVFLALILCLTSIKSVQAEEILIIFSASWCQPCQVLKNDLKDKEVQEILKKRYGQIYIFNHGEDKYEEYANSYQVNTIPRIVRVKLGNPNRITGNYIGHANKKNLVDFLDTATILKENADVPNFIY